MEHFQIRSMQTIDNYFLYEISKHVDKQLEVYIIFLSVTIILIIDPYSILLVRCMFLKMSKKPFRIQIPSIFTYIACGSKALSQQLWYSFLFRLQFFGFTNKKASILNGKLTLVDVMKLLETLQLLNVLFLIS